VIVPFVDLQRQYQSIAAEIDAAIKRVADSGEFVGGQEVVNFEISFAKRYGIKNCVGTSSGTDSLFLILKALGVGPGDEVITPAFSCIPSAEVISLVGATVVFCDVDPIYSTLDPEKVKEAITSKTKAVIAVHLYGQAARVDELKTICDKHELSLIEDCAQSHLTRLDDRLVGTFGVAGAFSFYPTKNLGAMGDAGCVITNDDTLAEKIRRLGNHGALQKNDHTVEGLNSRLDALQAAILSAKLKHLDIWTEKRRGNASLYNEQLNEVDGIVLPLEMVDSFHTFHIFCIRTASREALRTHLHAHGITTLIHYPQALPNTGAYLHLGKTEKDFPISYLLQNEVLSLPIYAELTEEETGYIAEKIKKFF
jgi:dTDP-4-amino-4,6-dideoxygalactose transaminase